MAALPTADFVQAASSVDAFEQKAGRIGGLMGNSLEVRAFARAMVEEHAQSARALIDAVGKAALPAPTTAFSAAQNAAVAVLYAVPARDFDRAYITGEIDSHQQALAAAQAYAAEGDNPAIKAVAAALAPIIQRHLDQARAVLTRVR